MSKTAVESFYKARHRIKQRMKDIMPFHDDKTLYFYRGLELALIIINDCMKGEDEEEEDESI